MRTILAALLFITISTAASADQKHFGGIVNSNLCINQHCPVGAPADNFIVDHGLIILSSNRETKFADWVAYKVKKDNLGGESATRHWKKDPYIPEEYTLIPRPDDYKGAYEAYNYDRGHQAPLGDFSNHKNYAVVNYLSNITPQKAHLNHGSWLSLENAERRLIINYNYNDFYVATGPYYIKENPMPLLPNARVEHAVPNGYWKVLIVLGSDQSIYYAAFSFSQETSPFDSYCAHRININQIKQLTSLDILPTSAEDSEKIAKDLGC